MSLAGSKRDNVDSKANTSAGSEDMNKLCLRAKSRSLMSRHRGKSEVQL